MSSTQVEIGALACWMCCRTAQRIEQVRARIASIAPSLQWRTQASVHTEILSLVASGRPFGTSTYLGSTWQSTKGTVRGRMHSTTLHLSSLHADLVLYVYNSDTDCVRTVVVEIGKDWGREQAGSRASDKEPHWELVSDVFDALGHGTHPQCSRVALAARVWHRIRQTLSVPRPHTQQTGACHAHDLRGARVHSPCCLQGHIASDEELRMLAPALQLEKVRVATATSISLWHSSHAPAFHLQLSQLGSLMDRTLEAAKRRAQAAAAHRAAESAAESAGDSAGDSTATKVAAPQQAALQPLATAAEASAGSTLSPASAATAAADERGSEHSATSPGPPPTTPPAALPPPPIAPVGEGQSARSRSSHVCSDCSAAQAPTPMRAAAQSQMAWTRQRSCPLRPIERQGGGLHALKLKCEPLRACTGPIRCGSRRIVS